MILLDTNILLRLAHADHPHHNVARKAIRVLKRGPKSIHIVPQNLFEFWAVATRPRGPSSNANGLGLTSGQADFWLGYLQRTFSLLEDRIEIRHHWHALVRDLDVRGRKSYDARLVAAMQAHSIGELLTFNGADFKRFSGINVIGPSTLV